MQLSEPWNNLKKNTAFRDIYFLAIALILAFGTLQTAGTALNTDQPVVSVVSCSMYPGPNEEGLYKGDILIVKGTPFEDINNGDTIVYDVPDRIDFSIEGKDYSIVRTGTNQRDSVETPIGRVSLIKAQKISGKVDRASITVEGKREIITEDNGYVFNGVNMKVDRIDSMPIPVVHRVVKKHRNNLETKGINNPSQLEFEQDVTPKQIHGKVSGIVPRIGLIKILAMDLVGFNGDKPFLFDNYSACEVKA